MDSGSLLKFLVMTFCGIAIFITINCGIFDWYYPDADPNTGRCGAGLRKDIAAGFQMLFGFLLAYMAGGSKKD